MADEQTTQTTQEQGGAQTAGGDPNVSTQSFAQNILGDVNPDGIVRKTGAQEAAKTFTQDEVNDLIKSRLERAVFFGSLTGGQSFASTEGFFCSRWEAAASSVREMEKPALTCASKSATVDCLGPLLMMPSIMP